MKKIILAVFMILLFSCKKHYVYYPSIKGTVYSKEENKPLKNVKIYKPNALLNTPDTAISNYEGQFFIKGERFEYNPYNLRGERNFIVKHMAYVNRLKIKGYKEKNLDIRSFKNKSGEYIDTVNFNNIYLEKE
ncbi:hypothetical protein ASG22_17615 [Chryseobacterium sp. Leaf405]|uniref:hypothetical protein n=1 Tax=Chryseobacterium sp. Leaf405 TaxID=1736367 RepID=UPI0006FA0BE5|nr:hypothetical protein [Chryseobacterium sp. Leaf405]KQT33916.1 hypothetical protein ASG22_17615 [Chryseobacterium sp. Leaf405]